MPTNTIELYELNATTPFHTEGSYTLTLSVDQYGDTYYVGTTPSTKVAIALAKLDADRLELTLTPESGVGALRVGDVDGTPLPHTAGAPVSSGVSWTSTTSNGLAVIFTTPTIQDDQFDWKIGEAVPPVRLTVKIRRR